MKSYEHPYIVKYIDFFMYKKYPCIAMEYCENGTLYSYIREHVMLENTAVGFLEQIVSGLDFLHSKNVLHRDIKSKNILINGHNEAKIADFGVARDLSSESDAKLSLMVGTPQYMSPEMFAGKKYGKETDIWSLGCTCYEMVTREYPFNAQTLQAIKTLVESNQLPAIETTNFCTEIKQLIMEMLQTEAVKRPTAKQVLEIVHQHKCPNITTLNVNNGQSDSGRSTGSRSLDNTIRSTCSTLSTMSSTLDANVFQTQSCKYQAKLVRLIGDHEATYKVSKIMRVMKHNRENYSEIKATVERYVRNPDKFQRAYQIVMALKGVEEAISLCSLQSQINDSDSDLTNTDT